MSDPTLVAPEVVDALNQAARFTTHFKASSAEKAYQMVAQASAIAVQDAVDSLRNVGTLADAAAAAALSQATATGDPRYLEILKFLEQMRTDAIETFSKRTAAATEALKNFTDL